MKKSILVILVALLAVFALAACDGADWSDLEKCAIASNNLSISEPVVGSVNLPAAGLYETNLTWVSLNPEIIGDDGVVVNQPLYRTDVVFEVKIELGDASYSTYVFAEVRGGAEDAYFHVLSTNDAFLVWDYSDIEYNEGDDFVTLKNGGFTRFGENYSCYSSTFDDGFTTGVEIYLDPFNFQEDEGFIWSVGLSVPDEELLYTADGYLNEAFMYFKFTGGKLMFGTELQNDVSGGSNWGTLNYAVSCPSAREITQADWYTIVCTYFENDDGFIWIEWSVIRTSDMSVTYSYVQQLTPIHNDASGIYDMYLTPALSGGHRYGWFCLMEVANGIKARNVWLNK